MILTKRCRFDGKEYWMDIPKLTPELLAECTRRWDNGALVQDAFYFLNADEREFIMTGTPPAVWDELFKEV